MDIILLKGLVVGPSSSPAWQVGCCRCGWAPRLIQGCNLPGATPLPWAYFSAPGMIHMLPDAFGDLSNLFPPAEYPVPATGASWP